MEGDDEVTPQGFMDPRPSVNWLECEPGTLDEQLDRVRSRVRMKLGSTAKFARLKVSDIRNNVAEGVEVVQDPLPETPEHPAAPCHAEILGVESRLDYEALADNVTDLYDAVKSD